MKGIYVKKLLTFIICLQTKSFDNTDIDIALKVAKAARAEIFVVSKISKENMPVE